MQGVRSTLVVFGAFKCSVCVFVSHGVCACGHGVCVRVVCVGMVRVCVCKCAVMCMCTVAQENFTRFKFHISCNSAEFAKDHPRNVISQTSEQPLTQLTTVNIASEQPAIARQHLHTLSAGHGEKTKCKV